MGIVQRKTRYLIQHKGYLAYLNKKADELTKDMFIAIRFEKYEYADHWMKGIYAPKDRENYEIVPVRISIELEVEEDVQEERFHQKSSRSAS